MIKEKRYEYIEDGYRICGGVYTNEKGKVIMQSRYVIKLSWLERLWNKIFKTNETS